jgi:hypothetical protein
VVKWRVVVTSVSLLRSPLRSCWVALYCMTHRLTLRRQQVARSIEVQLGLLMPVTGPAIMPLSWDLTASWFASFGGVE